MVFDGGSDHGLYSGVSRHRSSLDKGKRNSSIRCRRSKHSWRRDRIGINEFLGSFGYIRGSWMRDGFLADVLWSATATTTLGVVGGLKGLLTSDGYNLFP